MSYIEEKKSKKKQNGFQKSLTNFINTEKCCIIGTQNQQVTKSLKSMI